MYDTLFNDDDIAVSNIPSAKASDRKSIKHLEDSSYFLSKIERRDEHYYTDKNTIDIIGRCESKGEDFSLLSRKNMSSRTSTEGGTSVVYKYSDIQGTKYLIHEVTDLSKLILHRDFDAVRIASGQIINKRH